MPAFALIAFALLLLLYAGPAPAQQSARYVGPDGGLWSLGENWDIGQVPVNGNGNRFTVEIEGLQTGIADVEVLFDLQGAAALDGLSVIEAGLTLLPQARLEINDQFVLDGRLSISGPEAFMEQPNPLSELRGRARLAAADGARISLAAQQWLHPGAESALLLSAAGTATRIELPELARLDVHDTHPGERRHYDVQVSNGGHLDLRGLHTLTGPAGRHLLRLRVGPQGSMNLDSLSRVVGRTGVSVDVSNLVLPALESLEAGTGARWLHVSQGAALLLPALTELSDTRLESFGVIDSPLLAKARHSIISVAAPNGLAAPPLADIDGSFFEVSGGARLSTTDEAYHIDRLPGPLAGGEAPPFFWRAEGEDSSLDFSSLRIIDATAFTEVSGLGMEVVNGANIDLSGTEAVHGPEGEAWLTVRLVRNWPGAGASSVRLGDVTIDGRAALEATPGTVMQLGSLDLRSPARIQLAPADDPAEASTLALSGDFTFDHTDPADLLLGSGRLHVRDSHDRYANQEVAGYNRGVPEDGPPAGYEIGQLVVGEPGARSRLVLVDAIDNGQRGRDGQAEALYLQGLGSEPGLRLLGGSTLYLNDIDVYARLNGEWHHLNEWLPAGTQRIEFDQGYIARGDGDRIFGDRFDTSR